MIDPKSESMIRTLIVDAYMDALTVAERTNVSVDDFKLLARQILLGLFLSVNEIGLDHAPATKRLADLEFHLKEFAENGFTMYDQQLFAEDNAKRASSALRLCPEKSLTNGNGAGEIGPRQEKGES